MHPLSMRRPVMAVLITGALCACTERAADLGGGANQASASRSPRSDTALVCTGSESGFIAEFEEGGPRNALPTGEAAARRGLAQLRVFYDAEPPASGQSGRYVARHDAVVVADVMVVQGDDGTFAAQEGRACDP